MEEQHLDEEDIQSIRDYIKDEGVKADMADYEDFVAGPVWEDMKQVLQERIEGLLVKLESMSNTPQVDLIYKARLHEVRQLIMYPEYVIELYSVIKEEPDESNGLDA